MAVGRGVQRGVQQDRDRDREAGGDAAEEEFAAPRRDLLVGRGDDPLEDLVGGEAIANDRTDRRCAASGSFDRLSDLFLLGRLAGPPLLIGRLSVRPLLIRWIGVTHYKIRTPGD